MADIKTSIILDDSGYQAAAKRVDKIGGFDPAAAPLGTDDEAAGMPTNPVEEDANPGGAQVRRKQFRRE